MVTYASLISYQPSWLQIELKIGGPPNFVIGITDTYITIAPKNFLGAWLKAFVLWQLKTLGIQVRVTVVAET